MPEEEPKLFPGQLESQEGTEQDEVTDIPAFLVRRKSDSR